MKDLECIGDPGDLRGTVGTEDSENPKAMQVVEDIRKIEEMSTWRTCETWMTLNVFEQTQNLEKKKSMK